MKKKKNTVTYIVFGITAFVVIAVFCMLAVCFIAFTDVASAQVSTLEVDTIYNVEKPTATFSQGSANTDIYVYLTNSIVTPSLSDSNWIHFTKVQGQSYTINFSNTTPSYPRVSWQSSRFRYITGSSTYTDYKYMYVRFNTVDTSTISSIVENAVQTYGNKIIGSTNGTAFLSQVNLYGGTGFDEPPLDYGKYLCPSLRLTWSGMDFSQIDSFVMYTSINGVVNGEILDYSGVSIAPGTTTYTIEVIPYSLFSQDMYSSDDYVVFALASGTLLSQTTNPIYLHGVFDDPDNTGLVLAARKWYREGRNYGYATSNDYNFATMAFAIIQTPFKVLIGEYDDNSGTYVGGLLNFTIFGYNLRDIFLALITISVFLYILHLFIGMKGGAND